jgi:ABC-2 type transport system permease protein
VGQAGGALRRGVCHAGSALRRLARLWALYARMDLLFVARGPGAAITYYLADSFLGISAVTATFLLAERFSGIGTWTTPQVVFLLGYALLVRALVDVFFNWNVAFISRRIGRGQLDHLLLQPQPLWIALLTDGFSPLSGSGMLPPSILLLGWSVQRLGLAVTPGWLGLLGIDLLASLTIVLAFNYAWGSLAFWAPRAAEEINSQTWALVTQLDPFPLDGLGGPLLAGLVSVVPVGLVAWYPARGLVGIEAGPAVLLGPLGAALVLGALTALLFAGGLRRYARCGSSRYLDLGHRR